jgi:hypothetical protein
MIWQENRLAYRIVRWRTGCRGSEGIDEGHRFYYVLVQYQRLSRRPLGIIRTSRSECNVECYSVASALVPSQKGAQFLAVNINHIV